MTTQTVTMPTTRKRRSRKGLKRGMKVTRRIHMYLGLALVPWVLLFGVSGFLFNHNSTFWGGSVETVATIGSDEVLSHSSMEPLDLDTQMLEIIQRINAASDQRFDLKGVPWLNGHLRLSGRADNQALNLSIDPLSGATTVTANVSENARQEKPSFDGQKLLSSPKFVEAAHASLPALLASNGIELDGPLEIPTRGSNAEIRFKLIDSEGRSWRGSYNLANSTLHGVADDSESEYNFAGAVTRLHKTHHYPDTFGARWIWSVIGDVTAISMVVWGVTGLVMWWQIQPSRVIGTIAIFITAIAAFFVFTGTLDDYTHNPAQVRSR